MPLSRFISWLLRFSSSLPGPREAKMRRLIAVLALLIVVGIPSALADAQQTAEVLIGWATEVIEKAKQDGLDFVLPDEGGRSYI